MTRFLGLVSALALVAGSALAAGYYTPGMPTVGAGSVNGAAVQAPSGVVSELTGGMLLGVDTLLPSGQPPQSVAASVFQVAAYYAAMAGNTATSTARAATQNTQGGVITTESISTAAGATYTFTLTNSLITATSAPQVAMYSGTNTGGGVTLTSATSAAGSVVWVFTNTGTTAFNGTMLIVWHL